MTSIESGNFVPISSRLFHGKPSPAVDAEGLCSILSKTRFDTWITRRITEYGFVEGDDYLTEIRQTAGRPKRKYYLSLDMAKELAMVERNQIGRQVRAYFIECANRLHRQKTVPQINKSKDRLIQDAGYRNEARKFALEYFHRCRDMAPDGSKNPEWMDSATENRIADALCADILENSRWVVSFMDGNLRMTPAPRNHFIANWDNLVGMLYDSVMIQNDQLVKILQACAAKLQSRANHSQRQSAIV